MKLSVTQEIAAAPEKVFDRVADFARFEERALERGAVVEPLATDDGLGWCVLFEWHGTRHEVDLWIETLQRPEGYTARVSTHGIKGTSTVSVAPLEPGRTRLVVAFDLGATSFTGRLLMQTLAFARGPLEARIARRLEALAADLEGRG